MAPWEITRVQNDNGLIFFDADVNKITPAGLMNFKAEYGGVWYQTDVTNANRKVNADGKGWLAYYNVTDMDRPLVSRPLRWSCHSLQGFAEEGEEDSGIGSPISIVLWKGSSHLVGDSLHTFL